MDVISSLNTAISTVTRLREISKNISEAEFRNLLADLSNELADAKLQVASLKEQLAILTEENNALKATKSEQKETPTVKWGCYKFEGSDGLYCTACYDTKGIKVRTTRVNSKFRECPSCHASFGT